MGAKSQLRAVKAGSRRFTRIRRGSPTRRERASLSASTTADRPRAVGAGRRLQETAKFPASRAHACIACTATMTDVAATRKFPPRAEVSPVRLSGQCGVRLAPVVLMQAPAGSSISHRGSPRVGSRRGEQEPNELPTWGGEGPGHRHRRGTPGSARSLHSRGQRRRTEVAGPARRRSGRWPSSRARFRRHLAPSPRAASPAAGIAAARSPPSAARGATTGVFARMQRVDDLARRPAPARPSGPQPQPAPARAPHRSARRRPGRAHASASAGHPRTTASCARDRPSHSSGRPESSCWDSSGHLRGRKGPAPAVERGSRVAGTRGERRAGRRNFPGWPVACPRLTRRTRTRASGSTCRSRINDLSPYDHSVFRQPPAPGGVARDTARWSAARHALGLPMSWRCIPGLHPRRPAPAR